MARYSNKNSVRAPSKRAKDVKKVVNEAGGQAWTKTPEIELIGLLSTSKLQDDFYRSADAALQRVKKVVAAVNPLFAAKAAVYARHTLGMRTISHVVAAEVAQNAHKEPWMKDFMLSVVRRADDPIEILAYTIGQFGKGRITKSVKCGLGASLGNFDAYQIAKYRREGNALSMIDAVNLLHPSSTIKRRDPKSKALDVLNQLMNGTLPSAETWEAKQSKAGMEASNEKELSQKKADNWKELLDNKKLPYFAAVRNARNILQQAPGCAEALADYLAKPKAVKNSLLFPYHFFVALKVLEATRITDQKAKTKVMKALDAALNISCDNVPEFEGRTLVVTDHSSSMDSAICLGKDERNEDFTTLSCMEVGDLMAIMMAKKNNADCMLFGTDAKYFELNSLNPVSTEVSRLKRTSPPGGHNTNFHAIFERATESYDRIFIFSDMQGWFGYETPERSFQAYKKRTGSNAKIYLWDLRGHSTTMFPEKSVYQFAGFSSKIFDQVKEQEIDPRAVIALIEAIEFKKF